VAAAAGGWSSPRGHSRQSRRGQRGWPWGGREESWRGGLRAERLWAPAPEWPPARRA
jgi:hypothetical protein